MGWLVGCVVVGRQLVERLQRCCLLWGMLRCVWQQHQLEKKLRCCVSWREGGPVCRGHAGGCRQACCQYVQSM